MKLGTVVRAGWMALVLGVGSTAAGAQTLATGDSRTVTEPVFPVSCTVLTAQQAIVNGNPASETLYDTSRIQAALTACPKGQAVELAGANGNFAYLTATLNIPNGVGLIVDGGVTLFMSRRGADYQLTSSSETCGSYGSSGNACNYFFTFNNGSSNTGSGIYGYGVIDGRGGSTILDSTGADTGVAWWTNSDRANTAGASQDNPSFLKPNRSTNLTFYKVTFRNSPQFHLVTSNVSGETVWGVKIQAPFTAHNTDGIDPQGTNVTITQTSISEGDDAIAVSASSNSTNVTISNSTIYSSHGISVGSYTQGGLNNMLVKNVNMAGEPADNNQNGLRLKSAKDRGGLVQNVTYQNICMRDIYRPIYVTPAYNTNSGTLIPTFSNIVYQNIHVLPTTKATKYYVSIAGNDATHASTVTLDNVVLDQVTGYSPVFSYDTITLLDNQYPASLTTQAGTGVTYAGTPNVTAVGAYDCSNTNVVFPYMVGELYESTASATNLQTATIAGGATATLNAMLQPAKASTSFTGTVGTYTGAAALTQAVNFYEGMTLVGSAVLGANGTNETLASLTLSGVKPGTHTYTAQYPGDSNYSALTFGSVTLTVTGPTVTSTTTLTAPATATYGTATTLGATVTGSGGTPSGTVSFYDGATLLGMGTLSSGSTSLPVTLGGGPHSLKATYNGDNTFVTSSSTVSSLTVAMAASITAVTANPSPANADGTTTLTATVAGVSGGSTPTGTVTFTDGTNNLGSGMLNTSGTLALAVTLPTPGTRTVTATYGGDANYAGSSGMASEVYSASTVTTLTAPTSAVYGAGAAVSVTVSGVGGTPTGTVSVTDSAAGGASVGTITLTGGTGGGTGSTILNLSGGTHVLTASYAATTAYATSSSTASTLTITVVASTTKVTANPSPANGDGTTSLTATVTGVNGGATPGGMVTFTDGTTNLGSGTLAAAGTLTLPVTLASVGTRTITATYAGNGNYAGSSGTVSVAYTASTTTKLSLPSTAVYGAGATASVTVSGAGGTPTGTVTINEGSTSVGSITLSGGAGSTTLKLPGGAHTLTASYGGDGNYAVSGSTASTLTVTQAVSGTVLTAASASVAVNGTDQLAVTVSGVGGAATPGGTVTITDGSSMLGTVTLSGGTGTVTPALPNVGSRTLTAQYNGDSNYAASSGTVGVSVTQPTTTTLAIAPATTYPGATVTLTATVSPAPSGGTVTFSNGSTANVNAVTGVATTTLTAGAAGAFTYTASFSGAGSSTGSTSTSQTLTVVVPVSLNSSATALTILPGSSGMVTLSVASGGGYAGAVTVSCASPVSYVTCSVSPTSVTPGALGTSNVTGAITVAASTSMLQRFEIGITFALLAPFGLLLAGMRRRTVPLQRLAVWMIAAGALCGALGLAGCGGSASSGGGSTVNKPTGSQTVVFSATAGATTQQKSVVVSFQ